MAERRTRPVITATVSQEAHDYIKKLSRKASFNKSVFIDKLILAYKRMKDGN